MNWVIAGLYVASVIGLFWSIWNAPIIEDEENE